MKKRTGKKKMTTSDPATGTFTSSNAQTYYIVYGVGRVTGLEKLLHMLEDALFCELSQRRRRAMWKQALKIVGESK